MQPYYDDGQVQIWHGDCQDVLPTLEAGSVDLIVTDPPYGVKWQSNHRQVSFMPMAGDHNTDAAIEGLRLALLALKQSRHVYAFGRYDLSSLPLVTSVELIWDKCVQSSGDLTLPWGSQHEYIQFAAYYPSGKSRSAGCGRLTARLRKGSVLRYQRLSNAAALGHPAEKPVRLLRELIESSSCIGETVLDPFVGIGSTLVAARVEERRAIGIEIEERYCEIAAKRLQQLVLL